MHNSIVSPLSSLIVSDSFRLAYFIIYPSTNIFWHYVLTLLVDLYFSALPVSLEMHFCCYLGYAMRGGLSRVCLLVLIWGYRPLWYLSVKGRSVSGYGGAAAGCSQILPIHHEAQSRRHVQGSSTVHRFGLCTLATALRTTSRDRQLGSSILPFWFQGHQAGRRHCRVVWIDSWKSAMSRQ